LRTSATASSVTRVAGSSLDEYPVEFDVRSYRMNTFRYSLVVATVDGEPMVYAVAHQHRRPGYWRDRLA